MRILDLFEGSTVRNTVAQVSVDRQGFVSCDNILYKKLSPQVQSLLPCPKHNKRHVEGLLDSSRNLGIERVARELTAYKNGIWPE